MLVYRQKFVPKKKCSLKQKIFTLNLSRISLYGLLYQVYMLTNSVISSRTACALITDLILGNSGFGDLVKLLNLRWALNVMVIFYIFARDSNYGIDNLFLMLLIVGQKFQITVLPPISRENFCCIKKTLIYVSRDQS